MKSLVLFSWFWCLGLLSIAQDSSLRLVNPLPVSPQAASFTKYGDIPVSLNSGVANISIPIAEVRTGEIGFPITLSYNPSGIRVEEIASNVGLGWTLNFGGSITRQVRGMPDEGSFGFFSQGSYVQQFIYGTMTSAQRESFLTNYRYGFIDGQPDVYYYTLPGGQSGKFFFDSTGRIVCYPETNLKVQMIGTLSSWKITSDEGIQYLFNAVEATSSGTISVTNGTGVDGNTTYGNTSWLLTKIVDPAGNEVDFTYGQNESHYSNKAVETYKVNYSSNTGALNNVYTLSTTTNDIVGQKISSIQWREGQIDFSYANSERQDLQTTDTALSAITILNNKNNIVKSYRLYTSYFNNLPTFNIPLGDSTYYFRLRLDSVQEIGTAGLTIPPYKFDYNPQNLEARISDNQDTWGYFNGKSNTMFVSYSTSPVSGSPKLGADKSIDTNYTQADMLQTVHYPTGGSSSFEYEANRYAQYQYDTTFGFAGTSFGGITGNNGTYTDPDQYAFDFDSTFTITSANATYDGTAVVLSQMDSACSVPGGDYCILTVTLYNPDGSVNRLLKASDTLYLSPGNYTLHGHIETEFGAGSPGMAGYYSYFNDYLYLGSVQLPGFYDQLTGGVRIKRITDNNGLDVTGIKEFTYNTFGQNYSSGSIGDFGNIPQYYHPELDASSYGPTDNEYYVYSSTSNFPLTTSGGAYVTYANVEEVDKDSIGNTNGKSDFYYTTFADHPDGNDALDFPFPPPCSFEWQRGLLIRQDDFRSNSDGSYTLLRQKFNNYAFLGDSSLRGVDGFMMAPENIFSGEYTDSEVNAGYIQSVFHTVAQVYYLQSDSSVLYSSNGDSNKIITTNNYNYKEQPILLQSQQTVASNGDIKKIDFRYAGDLASYGFVGAMDSANDIATPIETVTSRIKPSGQQLVTGGVITSFKPAQLTKDKIYTVQTAQDIPIGQYQNASINSSGILQLDSSYQLFLQFNRYDSLGNIVEEQKTGDMLISYLWDYAHTAPIAGVKNADSASIAYTSFEADGTGNWSIGSGSVDTTTAITGRNSYNLTGSISKSGLNSSTTYIVSYWSQNGAYSIPGTIAGYPVQGKTVTFTSPSWTLYIHKVTGQSTITLSGNGHIDELRLYPSTAQMTTYTYTPLVGMTSQTDAGNRVTYYEYDGLARLKRIRDQDYDILKSFDYQYQTAGGCGSGCYILSMQTFTGTGTLSYPVGVFNISGKLVGNASSAANYVTLWNSDTADNRIGTLSTGADSMHFNITINSGQTAPASVIGCRYYQYDFPYTQLNCVSYANAAYIDFGDGSGMSMPLNDSQIVHNYIDTSLKTITFYHNDASSQTPAIATQGNFTSEQSLENLRGNIPQFIQSLDFLSYHQPSALSVSAISNWNSINSLTTFDLTSELNFNACLNVNFAQDFMAGNKHLQMIDFYDNIFNIYSPGFMDSSFKISRLKSDWNTYFTDLKDLQLSDFQWNREDLSALTNLTVFVLVADNQQHDENMSDNPAIPLPSSVIDNVLIEIAAGSGPVNSNGLIIITTGGSNRTSASDSAYNFLVSKGWTIVIF